MFLMLSSTYILGMVSVLLGILTIYFTFFGGRGILRWNNAAQSQVSLSSRAAQYISWICV